MVRSIYINFFVWFLVLSNINRWLESSSYPIEVLDHERVKVLVRSEELGKQYKADPVIVRITWGKGVVYHMISHFYLQRSETK
mgnify:CR=1 FL=1